MSVQVSRNAGVSERLPWTPVTTIAPSAAPSKRGAAADRAPDDDGEADRNGEEGRRGEFHHQRVEHAREAGDAGRERRK